MQIEDNNSSSQTRTIQQAGKEHRIWIESYLVLALASTSFYFMVQLSFRYKDGDHPKGNSGTAERTGSGYVP